VKTVSAILGVKGSTVYSITPDATVYDALKQMAEQNVGALLVLEGQKIVGLISERDYARKTILKGRLSKETAVSEIMTANVITVGPEEELEKCMELFTDKHVRHLPVIANEKILGIVSIGDVVKGVIDYKEFIIQEQEKYIKGKR
jgi:CBS domain-containing protein